MGYEVSGSASALDHLLVDDGEPLHSLAHGA